MSDQSPEDDNPFGLGDDSGIDSADEGGSHCGGRSTGSGSSSDDQGIPNGYPNPDKSTVEAFRSYCKLSQDNMEFTKKEACAIRLLDVLR